jgi:hypothetical protein
MKEISPEMTQPPFHHHTSTQVGLPSVYLLELPLATENMASHFTVIIMHHSPQIAREKSQIPKNNPKKTYIVSPSSK